MIPISIWFLLNVVLLYRYLLVFAILRRTIFIYCYRYQAPPPPPLLYIAYDCNNNLLNRRLLYLWMEKKSNSMQCILTQYSLQEKGTKGGILVLARWHSLADKMIAILNKAVLSKHYILIILHFTVFLVEEEEEDSALISQPRVETQCPHNHHR